MTDAEGVTSFASTGRLTALATASGAATAVSLVLPWLRIGSRNRSSIDLIGSAGALDVIDGSVRVAVVATWFLVPLLAAAAMLAGAAGRHRLASGLLVPLAPTLAGVVILGWAVAGDGLAWGAYLTAALALTTGGLATFLLWSNRRPSTADSA